MSKTPIVFRNELLISQFSRECIEDCSRSGQNLPSVQYWINETGFTIGNRAAVIEGLKSYGAWDDDELNAETNEGLAEKIFWLAMGTFGEYITECERRGDDPFDGEYHECNCGSDLFCLT